LGLIPPRPSGLSFKLLPRDGIILAKLTDQQSLGDSRLMCRFRIRWMVALISCVAVVVARSLHTMRAMGFSIIPKCATIIAYPLPCRSRRASTSQQQLRSRGGDCRSSSLKILHGPHKGILL
jgi:hypothetical protein